MQCPKCNYEPTMAEMQSSPEQCPSCGVYYSKVRASVAQSVGADQTLLGKVSAGVSGARAAVSEAREIRRADAAEREAMSGADRARAVVVVDVDMPFWSLVQLMVKIALAAIPAVIIIAIIFAGFSAIISLIGR